MKVLVVLSALLGLGLTAPQSLSHLPSLPHRGTFVENGVEYALQPVPIGLVGQKQVKSTLTTYTPKIQISQPAYHVVSKPTLLVQKPTIRVQQPQVSVVQQPQIRFSQPQAVHTGSSIIPIAILRSNANVDFDGNFHYDFETENGISAQADGALKNVPESPEPGQTMRGSYSYTSPEGTPITVTWYADETGFHAEGDHLPVPPPIPDEIAKSLEYLRTLPPNPQDAKYN